MTRTEVQDPSQISSLNSNQIPNQNPNQGEAKAQIFDYDKWFKKASELKRSYQTDRPFPHIVMDGIVNPDLARQAAADYAAVDWQSYRHYNENKQGGNAKTLPSSVATLIGELNSPEFLKFLTELTGIENLIADPGLTSAGPHQSERGGFLNIHADFTVHPYRHEWRRRLNVLVYLNEGWQDDWGSHLELWSRDMKECQVKVAPIFNRCVVFSTDETSFHGHPEPTTCPPGVKRKSIALYYYSIDRTTVPISTEYRARPKDNSFKAVLIFIDKLALRTFHKLKSTFNIPDTFVTRIMDLLPKKRK